MKRKEFLPRANGLLTNSERREEFMAAARANLKDRELREFVKMLDHGDEDDVLIGFIWDATEQYEFDEKDREEPGWRDEL